MTFRMSGSSDDWASAMAVGACGNVYVTGQSGDQYTTLAYSSAGTPLWTNCYATPNEYLWPAMAVDANENVYVAGTYWDGTYFGYVTIKYSVPRPIPLTLQLLDNQLVLSWTNAAFHLQCAPTITAPFTNMPGATSPYTNFMTGAQSFFRLIRN